MAADVTLLALPATPHNWRTARLATYEELWHDDEAVYHDGELVGIVEGSHRSRWTRDCYERVDSFEVGPISWIKAAFTENEDYLPRPTQAVAMYWATPALITRATIAETMVRMNLPDRSHYREWRRRLPRGFKAGRRYTRGMRGYRRVARRQDVRRWLTDHSGWIAWAESW